MRLRNVRRTNFEDQSTQGRAPGAAVEPKEEGVLARPALRRDEVVEELRAVHLVHFHVPTAAQHSWRPIAYSYVPVRKRQIRESVVPCLQMEGKGAAESGQVGNGGNG